MEEKQSNKNEMFLLRLPKEQKEKIIKTNRKHFELNVCDDTGRSFR